MKTKSIRATVMAMSVLLCATAAVSAISGDGASAPSKAIAPVEQEVTLTWDYSNSTVMAETMALSGKTESGEVKAGNNENYSMTVLANGAAFRDNGGNIQVRSGAEFRVPVQSTDDVVTVKGYPGYSYYTIGGGAENQNTKDNPETTYKAKFADVQQGYVSIVSTNDNNYYYSISVTLVPERGPVTLENEAVTATFVLDEGNDTQKATFGDAGDYFLTSKIAYGSNITCDGNDNKSLKETWFGVGGKDSKADDSNFISFTIQPKRGLVFTPTKVSFKATRFGTDGGKLDIAWVNPDGTKVSLETGKTPNRDNAATAYTEYSYTITGAAATDGACGLYVNLYSLDKGKRVGFKDVVIEGTLSGTEIAIPVLASFEANDKTYQADDIFEADGNDFRATLYLASYETMISAENPISKVVAAKGELGTITYKVDGETCDVTIPMTLGDVATNYIVKFVRKPLLTVTYYDTDGTEMGTQSVEQDEKIVEFAVDYTTAKVEEGYKVRGWFAQPTYGRKVFVDDVIVENTSLYAVATEIETVSTTRKYEFDLTNQYFYPEDHEAFSTEAGYFHDTTHGWAFRDGDQISLLVGPKASISVALCRYGYGTNIVIKDDADKELGKIPAISADETDGEVVAFNYEGEGGTVTLNFEATGELYIHSVKILNNSEVNYERDGQWFFVKPGDAQSLLDVIEAVSAINADREAERAFIFIPNGTYDLKETVLTNISGHNISLIGQSMEGTIIKNAPHYSTESIDKTATLMNTGTNIYLQDLTLQNDLDYYATIAGQQVGGRAVAWWDKGTNTICKNVTLLSHQDTYYTNNVKGQYYWTDSDVHGTVDFFCGEGRLFYENSKITVEMRNLNGKGECTLTAPATIAGEPYGYVFSNCTVVNYAEKYNYGRAWQNEPRCAFINTTLEDPNVLISTRWNLNGIDYSAAKCFVEYNTMDASGKTISPDELTLTFVAKGNASNTYNTILSAEEAAEYTIEKVFPDWNPRELAEQVDAPEAKIDNGVITWEADEDALGYAIYKDGELLAIVCEGTTYTDENYESSSAYTIRAINSMGGHGVAAAIYDPAGVQQVAPDAVVVKTVRYNLQGIAVDETYQGVVIRVDTLNDGSTVLTKVLNR
ncbi:MAG: hypothetical protein J1E84_06720 [Muribaculaceae bacterium]|nr:hypothetical protein [Muribaculaceae bacterium]